MPLSDEERQRIYEEEKDRQEIKDELRRERSEGRPKLRKSRDNKVLFGVAGGLAEHFDIDPLLARVGFVAVFLFGGFGLVAYVVLAILMPSGDG